MLLTNQSTVTYKLLSNLAAQQITHKGINELQMDGSQKFTGEQLNSRKYVVKERYKFRAYFEGKVGIINKSGACQQNKA